MKINIYGINYEFFDGNIWTVRASVIVNGHVLLDRAEFKMPEAVRSFSEAEALIRELLTGGV